VIITTPDRKRGKRLKQQSPCKNYREAWKTIQICSSLSELSKHDGDNHHREGGEGCETGYFQANVW
jgi:pterin-4a-carbinolamine dehydratase